MAILYAKYALVATLALHIEGAMIHDGTRVFHQTLGGLLFLYLLHAQLFASFGPRVLLDNASIARLVTYLSRDFIRDGHLE